MPHLDEGQIHAWLDGALSADEGTRVEQHVAECTECSARVAEARGLIAASSRILSKLDDVPALAERGGASALKQMTTRAASVGKGSDPLTRLPARSVRRWFRPAYAAAAALAIAALGTWTVYQRSAGPPFDATDAAPTALATDARADRLDSGALVAPATSPSAASRRTVDLAKAEEARPVAPPTGATVAESDQTTGARKDRESQPTRAAQAASPGAREASRDEVAGRANEQRQATPSPLLDQVVVTGTGASTRQLIDSTRVAKAVGPRPAPAPNQRRIAVPADSLVAGEQRRLQGEMAASRVTSAPTAVGQQMLTAAMIDSMVNVFAGCYSVSGNARASAEGVPSRLALLTRSHRKVGDVQTWIASTTATVPTTVDWEWSIDAAFEVIVRRAAGGSSLSTSFSANTPADLLLRRVNCR